MFLLRREVNRLKVENYDLLVETVHGLRNALETQQRSAVDLYRKIDERDARIRHLQGEYGSLQMRLNNNGVQTIEGERLNLFKKLQSIAIQLPTMQAALADGAEIQSTDILKILSPLEQILREMGFEKIGAPEMNIAFDPQRHRIVGRGARRVQSGGLVRVRFIGYTYNGKVVCKAEVSPAEVLETAN